MSAAVQVDEYPVYTHMTDEIYDLIYSEKEYAAEAQKITEIVAARCTSGGKRMLDVACGTGNHIAFLSQNFDIDGVDLSAEQVAAAKKRFPDRRIERGDMTDFNMDEQYDVIVCLFSSIGYLQTIEKLNAAVANMAKHLKPGGVLIIEPWLKAENLQEDNVSIDVKSQSNGPYDYKLNKTSVNVGNSPRLHVVRMGTISTEDGLVTTSEMHHMVARDGGSVEHFIETHKLAMYSDNDFTDAFTKAGLDIEIDPVGLSTRGLYIGHKTIA